MNNLSERLNHALKITKIRKAELARLIDVKAQTIQFLCNGKTVSSRYTFEIAEALGINVQWLASGEGEIFSTPIEKTIKMIPVFNQDALHKKIILKREDNECGVSAYLSLRTQEKNIFAYQLIDSSMAPTLPLHSFLFINPANKSAEPGSFYLTYSSKYNSFMVRELVIRDEKQFLTPKNQALFNEIHLDSTLIMVGKVIAYFTSLED